jgi:sulfate transport system ATP-binding protein
MEEPLMSITIKELSKVFGLFPAVENINLEIPTGDFLALLGPSGSGKTTLLRLIAGLERPNKGEIFFNHIDFTDKSVKQRRVGFVFQNYALFKHMTIFDNIAFGLKVLPRRIRPKKAEIKRKVGELLQFIQLEELADRYPSQLSGGQRQRVALARALAVEPDVLLLDEPFGALDAKVRQELRLWLREVHQKLNITTIFVTHDQEEALEMADTVVVMNNGRIEQIGTPQEVYEKPANAFVYSFLGRVNEFRDSQLLNSFILPENSPNKETIGYIRPHEILLSKAPMQNSLPAKVVHLHSVGAAVRMELRSLSTNELFEVEITTEKFQELSPLKKEEVLYANINKMAVFHDNRELTYPFAKQTKIKTAF